MSAVQRVVFASPFRDNAKNRDALHWMVARRVEVLNRIYSDYPLYVTAQKFVACGRHYSLPPKKNIDYLLVGSGGPDRLRIAGLLPSMSSIISGVLAYCVIDIGHVPGRLNYLRRFADGSRRYAKRRRTIAHVCFIWRSVVRNSPEFWDLFWVRPFTSVPYLTDCILRRGDRSMVVDLFLMIRVAHSRRKDYPNPVDVLRVLQASSQRIVVMKITVNDVTGLKALQSLLGGSSCSALRTLELKFDGRVGSSADLPTLPFPIDLPSLYTLRMVRVRVDWSSRGFRQLSVLVLRDMGSIFGLELNDFSVLFAGASHLQKLAVRNVACRCTHGASDSLIFLHHLDEIDICFGPTTSFESVLSRMRFPSGISLHFHGSESCHIFALARCRYLMESVDFFASYGSADDPVVIHHLFMRMCALTRLILVGAEVGMFDGLRMADNALLPAKACSRLKAISVHETTAGELRDILMDRGTVVGEMDIVSFNSDWVEHLEADCSWFRSMGMAVGTDFAYKSPVWLNCD
ncbi:hypothetical protein C8J57DRAFT_1245639 [Mycena rebaudengoi]|nr:hypothetical protein C8J57DRAFT_1245639 [Mycena rebaudengoi]